MLPAPAHWRSLYPAAPQQRSSPPSPPPRKRRAPWSRRLPRVRGSAPPRHQAACGRDQTSAASRPDAPTHARAQRRSRRRAGDQGRANVVHAVGFSARHLADTRLCMTALASMTGFARAEGRAANIAWVWELRSVNGRGLDLRFRLPPGSDAMEPVLREAATKVLRRGNVTASLSVRRESEPRLVADPTALEQVLELAMQLHQRLPGSPVPRAEALLALPGVLRPASADETAVDTAMLVAGFSQALDALVVARQAEGSRLSDTLIRLLGEIAALRRQAVEEAARQPE